jgi:hypothetical protein
MVNHLKVNASGPSSSHLFSYQTKSGCWISMVKSKFLNRCHTIWSSLGLLRVHGHSFWIGGATELLMLSPQLDNGSLSFFSFTDVVFLILYLTLSLLLMILQDLTQLIRLLMTSVFIVIFWRVLSLWLKSTCLSSSGLCRKNRNWCWNGGDQSGPLITVPTWANRTQRTGQYPKWFRRRQCVRFNVGTSLPLSPALEPSCVQHICFPLFLCVIYLI